MDQRINEVIMLVTRRRHNSGNHLNNIWPGFVDALSTLLMVVIFVLMLVFVAQFSMSFMLQHKENNIQALQNEMEGIHAQLKVKSAELDKILSDRQAQADHVTRLELLLSELKQSLGTVQKDLGSMTTEKNAALDEKEKLQKTEQDLINQIASLHDQIQQLTNALRVSEDASSMHQTHMLTLQEKLDQALAHIQAQNKKQQEESMHMYRSEFFGKLKNIIGDRSDIRVVGDRFVFQSEVFFDVGSSTLSSEGQRQLNQLAHILADITPKIPENVKWILRVDGHTDQRPIHTQQFASNWELSSARAIAVVKHLISKGLSPERLVAAGFGEHQPMVQKGNETDLARNRRIEFKLDQR